MAGFDGHWRDSARNARFWIFDAEASVPFLLLLVHIRMWTFWLAMCSSLIFALLNRYGYTIPVFMRIFRGFLVGPLKHARPWWSAF